MELSKINPLKVIRDGIKRISNSVRTPLRLGIAKTGHESEQRIDRKRSVAVRGETVLFIDERKRLEGSRHPATCP